MATEQDLSNKPSIWTLDFSTGTQRTRESTVCDDRSNNKVCKSHLVARLGHQMGINGSVTL